MATVREIQSIDPYDFEKLVAELWETKGYETNVRSKSSDKGIDIDAERAGISEKIQVKRYGQNNKIGSREVRIYATIYQQTNANNVALVTSGEFTDPARQRAQELSVDLYSGKELLRQLESSSVDISDYTDSSRSGRSSTAGTRISNLLLPPDSSGLFRYGELQDHNFVESSFTEDDIGTSVSEFDLTNVDTSNVTNMQRMFLRASSFNQDIGNWDTSNVTNMQRMFKRARSFNQDIGNWDTSNVETMNYMFSSASSFDQDISGWDTSSVETMNYMFSYASSFDQDISAWRVGKITQKPSSFDEKAGFRGVTAKQPNWVTDPERTTPNWGTLPERTTGLLPPDSSGLFRYGELQDHNFAESSFTVDDVGTSVTEFDLRNTDTSNVRNMETMFYRAESFDQDIGGWDTSNVETMEHMFNGAKSFDQDIGGWDTSNVETMNGMFLNAQSFDQDIGGWDTSTVETMSSMFLNAQSFDQDISAWCVEQIAHKPSNFDEDAGFQHVNKRPNWGDTC